MNNPALKTDEHAPHRPARPSLTWQWSAFAELTTGELYALLALREAVFVVEQGCIFHDIDGLDQSACHLLGWQGSGAGLMLAAYLRVLPPGLKSEECVIGRVLTASHVRGNGFGRLLVNEGLRRAAMLHGPVPVRIGAQLHLEKFYASFGFETTSAPYDDANILHIEMLRPISGATGDLLPKAIP